MQGQQAVLLQGLTLQAAGGQPIAILKSRPQHLRRRPEMRMQASEGPKIVPMKHWQPPTLPAHLTWSRMAARALRKAWTSCWAE